MTSRKAKLYKDENGILRSAPLPRMPGKNLILPDQISSPENEEAWKQAIDDPSKLIVLDLFSGAGGFSYGFQSAGFFVAAGVDHDDASVATHSYNFLSKSIHADIVDIKNPREFVKSLGIPRVDVIIGGPPCQGFSQIGKAAIRKLGLEAYYHDILNNLYKEFLRFVDELRPQAFVMENVPAMASFQNGELVKRIKETIVKLGYNVEARILNAVDFGVPQKRRRFFIQGNKLGKPIVWPDENDKVSTPISLRDAISDLPRHQPPQIEDVVQYNAHPKTDYQKMMRSSMGEQNVVFDHIIRAVRDDDKLIFSKMKEGHTYLDVPAELRRYGSDNFKDKYSKMIWDKPSWTITAHIRKDAYRYIHPDKKQSRMLSIREFARLQSFPDHFRFCGAATRRMQQIGNAVPPLLAEVIARKLFDSLTE